MYEALNEIKKSQVDSYKLFEQIDKEKLSLLERVMYSGFAREMKDESKFVAELSRYKNDHLSVKIYFSRWKKDIEAYEILLKEQKKFCIEVIEKQLKREKS